MIHCIGDSHASIFSGSQVMQPMWPLRSKDVLPPFKSYRIGPATAFQIESKRPILNNIITQLNKEKDSLLFCFGEVDCRAHLKKQMDIQKKTVKEVVKECVDRYFNTILFYKDKGIDVMVWGPIASWGDKNSYPGPSFGTNLERNEITREFNEYIKLLCDDNKITFITVFYDMLEPNGETNVKYTDSSGIHLNNNGLPLINKAFKDLI